MEEKIGLPVGNRRVGNRSIVNPAFPLKQICICSECNKSLTGSASTGRKGKKYPYYHHHKQGCSKDISIPQETFEQNFVKYLNEITPDAKYEKLFKAIVIDIWQNNYKKLNENNQKVQVEVEKLDQDIQKVFDFHRNGKYDDEEFQNQKAILLQMKYQKLQLLQDNHIEEFNMEEALSYCFQFVRQTSKTWLRLKNTNNDHLIRFQKLIFPEKVTFNGEKFGTTELSLIYKLNVENGTEKDTLVSSPSLQWNTIENMIIKWNGVFSGIELVEKV